jgi:hypothetical protein
MNEQALQQMEAKMLQRVEARVQESEERLLRQLDAKLVTSMEELVTKLRLEAKLQDAPPLDDNHIQNLISIDLDIYNDYVQQQFAKHEAGIHARIQRWRRQEVARSGSDEIASWEARGETIARLEKKVSTLQEALKDENIMLDRLEVQVGSLEQLVQSQALRLSRPCAQVHTQTQTCREQRVSEDAREDTAEPSIQVQSPLHRTEEQEAQLRPACTDMLAPSTARVQTHTQTCREERVSEEAGEHTVARLYTNTQMCKVELAFEGGGENISNIDDRENLQAQRFEHIVDEERRGVQSAVAIHQNKVRRINTALSY